MSQWGLNYEMTLAEFDLYKSLLQSDSFQLYPNPKISEPNRWKFVDVQNQTHAILHNQENMLNNPPKPYYLPLALIQFVGSVAELVEKVKRRQDPAS